MNREEITKQFGPDVAHVSMLLMLAQAIGPTGIALAAETAAFIAERGLDVEAVKACIHLLEKDYIAYAMSADILQRASELSKQMH